MSRILRVHPAIGIARVGNTDEYYLSPETIAALPVPGADDGDPRTGGLPISPDTGETIKSSELRDSQGRFKRQAARFRIFAYPEDQAGVYPAQGAEEITIGSTVDGREVVDIIWQVHVANKKANWYEAPDDWGIIAFQQPQLGQLVLRNLPEGLDPDNEQRRSALVIDPGPRTISGASDDVVHFNFPTPATTASIEGSEVKISPVDYPKSFPRMHFRSNRLLEPQGPITTLGDLRTDSAGRLIVAGGHGKAVAWYNDQQEPAGPDDLYGIEITQAVNNDQWYDDTSDGPVTAILVFKEGAPMEVHGGWVITTDPGYAPQTLNVVSLWDDIYDAWIRKLDLDPEIYADGDFVQTYKPNFADQVQPIFKATAQQLWNTNLPRFAIAAHEAVGKISETDNPDNTVMSGLAFVRNPNNPEESGVGAPLMPLSLGDSTKSFLSPSYTQYFFLSRWSENAYEQGTPARPLGPGEYLDRATLQNCLGGRFSPGIDMTYISREPELYVEDWKKEKCGPFRINRKSLDYSAASKSTPFLTFGWVPCDPVAGKTGCEPGDVSKFMSIPWHSDYNSCAIHQTAPNNLDSSTLYWSWPAQRPVTVYVAADVEAAADPALPAQRYSIRGPGTMPGVNSPTDRYDLSNAGRFWRYNDFLVHWQDIGVIMQATNIDDGREDVYDPEWYLEVGSLLEDGPANLADPHAWPFNGGNDTALKGS